jgi:hypothetical protein
VEGTEERPFIETPEESDYDPEAHGLQCFLNNERPCDATCMSYTTEPSESPTLNDQQKHCVVIVALERLGRYGGAVAKAVIETKADVVRAIQAMPKGG